MIKLQGDCEYEDARGNQYKGPYKWIKERSEKPSRTFQTEGTGQGKSLN